MWTLTGNEVLFITERVKFLAFNNSTSLTLAVLLFSHGFIHHYLLFYFGYVLIGEGLIKILLRAFRKTFFHSHTFLVPV